MTNDEFKPRLGRLRDRGAGAPARFKTRIRRAAARLQAPRSHREFVGSRIGRGSAAARRLDLRRSPFAKSRARRAIVKVHIARANSSGGAAFRAHLKYLQRDGVDRSAIDDELSTEREDQERAGLLYDRSREGIDDDAFVDRSSEDRHQFRIILSPEDANQIEDLRETTRAFMDKVEQDLASRLDWVAVDHHNTGHPHTHIVIRGKDARGGDLIISKDYLMRGMRMRAQEVLMERLGPRRDLEIAAARERAVNQERWTDLDAALGGFQVGARLQLPPAQSLAARFEQTLYRRRLSQLERMGLVRKLGGATWQPASGWQDKLKSLSRRADIIRSLSAVAGRQVRNHELAETQTLLGRDGSVFGRVISNMPVDELRDVRAICVELMDGRFCHIGLGARAPGAIPPPGAIVSLSAGETRARKSDHTIAEIAAVNDGIYSEQLHRRDDPSAQPAYVEAHKRRLEALRRAGVAVRNQDGSFTIGRDFLQKAAEFDKQRTGAVRIDVRSWVSIETQAGISAPVWLDEVEPPTHESSAFARSVARAKEDRAGFLKRAGLYSFEHLGIDPHRASELRGALLAAFVAKEETKSSRTLLPLSRGEAALGTYERPVIIGAEKFALIDRGKGFSILPWREEIERHRGALLTLKRSNKGVTWTIGKTKSLSR